MSKRISKATPAAPAPKFPYKTSCELCFKKKGVKAKTYKGGQLFSFMDKKGRYRAVCKAHLKKVK